MTTGRPGRRDTGASARAGADPAVLSPADLRKFHLAVEQSFGLVVITDARGLIEYVNPRFVEATGYSRGEVLGQHVSVLSALPAKEDATLWETLRAGETWRGEVKGRRKDGETYWLLASVSPTRAEDGTITHFVGVNLDITDRKKGEEALRESEAHHRALLDSYPDGVAVLAGGRLAYVNPALCELSGYKTEEVIGKGPDDFLSPEERKSAAARVDTLLNGGAPSASTYHIVRKDGTTFPVEVISKLIAYRQGPALLSVLRDIRPRVAADRTLRESEAKFRTLAEASPMATFMVSAGRLLYVNEASAATYGYTREELLDMNPWEMVAPAFHAELRKQGEEHLQGTRDHVRIEMKLLSKTGEERWVDFAAGFAEMDGRRVAIGTSIDITERKRTEEALRESEARLRAFANAVPDAALVLDEDGRCLEVLGLPQKMALWYPDAESPKGRLIHEVLPPEAADLFLSVIRTTVETQEPQVVEYHLRVRDGPRWFEGRTAPLTLASAKKMIVWLAHDITQRKNMEEALQALREDLEEKAERRVEQGGGYGLTFRELTVLELIATGKPDKEIAVTLGISHHTANKHVAKILRKMNAASRTEASVRALREGLAG